METLLELLLARYERPEALAILKDPYVREDAQATLAPDLEAAGMPIGMLATTEGENLFVAILALRIKFPEAEAREKVALNIAMREQRKRTK